ncbi:four helix bundle protein [Aequorivita sp. SDUM287046]|uniref:Four helix bundle protein n=1 Tax=Aequorivita aurantiaca TaxID=3053356 RepID=A0ABT8DKR4_9FLAO|nr:four helix bundle protein [Aequorivita aurantiaca]MDN3723637.1 four helix bundle protein [Aequorivita aurantiaca]
MARHNFRKLSIWTDGVAFSTDVYNLTKKFPTEERFNLISQLNRAAVSIPSNIAEGSAKSSDKHFKIFLENSLGSAYECETQIEIAKRIAYLSNEDYEQLLNKIQSLQKRIGSFIDKLS